MQRVLVTGATGTLGSALVEALIEAGYAVAANFLRDAARAEQLAQKTGCVLWRGDMSDEAEVEKLFAMRFDAIFHLASISRDALLPRISSENWHDTLQFNTQSAFLVTRAGLQTLPPGGHLVLVASRVGERGFAGQAAYSASKGAVLGLMKTAALEGARRQIRVNAVCPGFTPSALSQNISPEIMAQRTMENWIEGAEAKQSFAALSLWLLQTRLTGQILRPDCRI